MKDWGEMSVKIAGYAGKGAKKVETSLDAMRPRQILLKSDWERIWSWLPYFRIHRVISAKNHWLKRVTWYNRTTVTIRYTPLDLISVARLR